MARIEFIELHARWFRNISELVLRPGPQLNVISGDNGQGKTSLLEALYFVAATRSFRAERLDGLRQRGAEQCVVRASIREAEHIRQQSVAWAPGVRAVLLDGKKPERLSTYATRTPVVVFHPGDIELVSAGAQGRRTLLDRVALYVEPTSGEARLGYVRAMRERRAALEARGPEARDLEPFEQLMAEHGARLAQSRALAAERLIAELEKSFARLSSSTVELGARYRAGGSGDVQSFAEQLRLRRTRDLRQRVASFGPHRDELELAIDGLAARQHASQGQQRVLALSLKLSELACIREARAVEPVLLLDDVSSELDPARTGAVYDLVRSSDSQVFATTTRPELFPTPVASPLSRVDFRLVSGALVGGG